MVLALSINNLLFLFRVRAVYGNSKGATFFFGFCYLVVFVTLWFVPSSLMAIVSFHWTPDEEQLC